jgi:hypothetical protein
MMDSKVLSLFNLYVQIFIFFNFLKKIGFFNSNNSIFLNFFINDNNNNNNNNF